MIVRTEMTQKSILTQATEAAKATEEGLRVGVVASDDDHGIAVEGKHALGKGWSIAGTFTAMRERGRALTAWLGWAPR